MLIESLTSNGYKKILPEEKNDINREIKFWKEFRDSQMKCLESCQDSWKYATPYFETTRNLSIMVICNLKLSQDTPEISRILIISTINIINKWYEHSEQPIADAADQISKMLADQWGLTESDLAK